MRIKRLLAVILLSCFILVCSAAGENNFDNLGSDFSNGRVIVQTGHIGAVNALRYQAGSLLLFSAGQDGTIKVWNTKTGELVRNLRIFERPVRDICLHPAKPYIAVLDISEDSAAELGVWDWKTGNKKYAIELKHRPLFFTFSAKGNFLLYGKPEWKSIVFINAETGEQLPYLSDGFGIVSYVTSSKTEKNLMTYQPSGKIMYWEILSGKPLVKEPYSTLSDLKAISISDKKTFFAAAKDNRLVIIDLLNGKLVEQYSESFQDAGEIVATDISPDEKEILVLLKKDNRSTILRFGFNGSTLKLKPDRIKGAFADTAVTPVYGKTAPFFSTPDGKILQLKNDNSLSVFSENILATISDIALTNRTAAIASGDRLIVFPVSLLKEDISAVDRTEKAYSVYDNDYPADIGLVFISETKLLSWPILSDPAGFRILNVRTGEIVSEYSDFPSPLVQLLYSKDNIISLDKTGECTVRDTQSFQPLFTYKSKGLNKITYVSPSMIVAARNRLNQFESPLVAINPKTGETVPVSDSSLFCYDLSYHPGANAIFSLGVDNKQPATTEFRMHTGKGYETVKVLSSFSGEDLSAGITIDDENKSVYTSLGYTSITAWDGKSISVSPPSPHIPRRIFLTDEMIVSLNRDGSLSVWNRKTLDRLFDFYIFNDFRWASVLPDNEYVTSSGGEAYVKLLPPAK